MKANIVEWSIPLTIALATIGTCTTIGVLVEKEEQIATNTDDVPFATHYQPRPAQPQLDIATKHEISLNLIGPAKVFELVAQDAVLLDNGGILWGSANGALRTAPWALSVAEQLDSMGDMIRATHGAMDHKEHFYCGQGILDRRHAEGRPVVRDLRWSMYLRWGPVEATPGAPGASPGAEASRLAIVDVEFGETPPETDQEALDCYADAYRGMSVPADVVPVHLRAGGFYTEWTNCIKLPPATGKVTL